MKIALLAYLVGVLFTHRMIVASNIPDNPHQTGSHDAEPNLSPSWALVWPVFWLKTIPIFYELYCEEKESSD